MPFFQPAAQAHQAKRHPALDVHVGREPHTTSSPGAGSDKPHLYYNKELDLDHDDPAVLTTNTPLPTNVVANVQLPSIGDVPAQSTVSTSVTTRPISGGLSPSSPVPSSTLSASSDIILSSSSSSLPISTLTTTPVTSSMVPQSSVSGSTTVPVRGGVTSSMPAESAVAGTTSTSSSRPSGGVIAAIVIVLLLALCAVAFFVFRRYRIQRRVARRVTWTTNLSPHSFDVSLEKGVDHEPAVPSDARVETASQLSKEGGNEQVKPLPPVRNIARKPPLPYSPVSPIAPSIVPSIVPSPSRSHITIPDATSRAPSMDSASVSTAPSTPVPEVPALVRMTFVAQLPDELAITPGETLFIRTEFDDGWASCVNSRGKEGMVPLECLEGGGGQFAGRSHLRNTRRASSLNSAASRI